MSTDLMRLTGRCPTALLFAGLVVFSTALQAHGGLSSIGALRDLFFGIFLLLVAAVLILLVLGVCYHSRTSRRNAIQLIVTFSLLTGLAIYMVSICAKNQLVLILIIELWLFVFLLTWFLVRTDKRRYLALGLLILTTTLLVIQSPEKFNFHYRVLADNSSEFNLHSYDIEDYPHGILLEDGRELLIFHYRAQHKSALSFQNGQSRILPALVKPAITASASAAGTPMKYQIHTLVRTRESNNFQPTAYFKLPLIEGTPIEMYYLKQTATAVELDANISGIDSYLFEALRIAPQSRWTQRLLDLNVDPDYVDAESGMSLLLAAARYGNADQVRQLIEKGADTHLYDRLGGEAVIRNLDISKLFLKSLDDPNKEGRGGVSPLMQAIINRDYDAARLLIELGADTNHVSKNGESPIYLASARDSKFVALLLENGASPSNTEQHLNNTPALIKAIRRKDYESTRLLLEHGADPNYVYVNGSTPLVIAFDRKDMRIAHLLLQHEADPNPDTNRGFYSESLLFRAMRADAYSTARRLIDSGADMAAINKEGDSLMHIAVDRNPKWVALMLQNWPNPEARNGDGITAFEKLKRYLADSDWHIIDEQGKEIPVTETEEYRNREKSLGLIQSHLSQDG